MPITHSTARTLARAAGGVTAAGICLLGYTLLEARAPSCVVSMSPSSPPASGP